MGRCWLIFLAVLDAEAVGRYALVIMKQCCAFLTVWRLHRDWLLEWRTESADRYCKTSWAGEPEIDPTLPEDHPVEGWELTPQECLDYAYGGVLREKSVICGSSTACILSLNASSGLLRAANLGDSGFLLIRSANLFHLQPPQTHGFNFPRQLSKFPNTKRKDDYYLDQPGDADNYSTQLRGGDILIAFTDGLSDNVFPAEAVQLSALVMRAESTPREQAQILADRLVLMANHAMWDSKKLSPFGLGMKRRGHPWDGGKVDDVLVVVALITED